MRYGEADTKIAGTEIADVGGIFPEEHPMRKFYNWYGSQFALPRRAPFETSKPAGHLPNAAVQFLVDGKQRPALESSSNIYP